MIRYRRRPPLSNQQEQNSPPDGFIVYLVFSLLRYAQDRSASQRNFVPTTRTPFPLRPVSNHQSRVSYEAEPARTTPL